MTISYEDLAKATRELYLAYLAAGFTEDQALELTTTQYAYCTINYTVQKESRKRDNIRRILNGYKDNQTKITEEGS